MNLKSVTKEWSKSEMKVRSGYVSNSSSSSFLLWDTESLERFKSLPCAKYTSIFPMEYVRKVFVHHSQIENKEEAEKRFDEIKRKRLIPSFLWSLLYYKSNEALVKKYIFSEKIKDSDWITDRLDESDLDNVEKSDFTVFMDNL